MANYFCDSDNIEVFPVTNRSKVQLNSRLLSEHTISGITRNLIQYEGYVKSQLLDLSGIFEFDIFGYYFKISSFNDIVSKISKSEDTCIYAHIYLEDVSVESNVTYKQLHGIDIEGSYRGIIFNTVETPDEEFSSYEHHTLKVLKYSNNSWIIPEDSMYRIKDIPTEKLTRVDGGII